MIAPRRPEALEGFDLDFDCRGRLPKFLGSSLETGFRVLELLIPLGEAGVTRRAAAAILDALSRGNEA